MITIYKITSPSGRVYIGQTKNFYKRKQTYKRLHCKTQYLLYNSLKKYGWEAHIMEKLSRVKENEADESEKMYIELYKTYYKDGRGMNLTRGGYNTQSEETKKKISIALLGSKNVMSKKLYQYNLDSSFIKEWSCMRDITRELGYVTTWLSKATKNNKIAYGFKWSYEPLHEQL